MVTNPTTQGGKTSTSTNEMILGPPMWLWWASLTPTWTISPSKGPCNFCDIRQVKRYLAMSHGLSTWPKRFSWAKRRPSLICPNQWVDLYFQQFKQSSWSSLLTEVRVLVTISVGHLMACWISSTILLLASCDQARRVWTWEKRPSISDSQFNHFSTHDYSHV